MFDLAEQAPESERPRWTRLLESRSSDSVVVPHTRTHTRLFSIYTIPSFASGPSRVNTSHSRTRPRFLSLAYRRTLVTTAGKRKARDVPFPLVSCEEGKKGRDARVHGRTTNSHLRRSVRPARRREAGAARKSGVRGAEESRRQTRPDVTSTVRRDIAEKRCLRTGSAGEKGGDAPS